MKSQPIPTTYTLIKKAVAAFAAMSGAAMGVVAVNLILSSPSPTVFAVSSISPVPSVIGLSLYISKPLLALIFSVAVIAYGVKLSYKG